MLTVKEGSTISCPAPSCIEAGCGITEGVRSSALTEANSKGHNPTKRTNIRKIFDSPEMGAARIEEACASRKPAGSVVFLGWIFRGYWQKPVANIA
jgi:hypothetical protein